MTTEVNQMKFNDAYNELEGISRELQNSNIDLDDLISKVKRASELIKYCQNKLQSAETEISTIIKDVESTTETTSPVKIENAGNGSETVKDDDLPF